MSTIDVFSLARTGATREGEIPLSAMRRLGAALANTAGSLRYRYEGMVDPQRRPALRLNLHGLLPLLCDRCGQELAFDLSCERQFFFVRSQRELDAIAVDATAEEPLLGDTHFDIDGLIEDEAILQLPMSPRHEHCLLPPNSLEGRGLA
jgi:uncharacterized protein